MDEDRKQWIREAVADTFAEEYVRELIEALEDAEDRAENWRTAYIDSVKAMLVAAGAPEDIDAMEAEVRACGTKPSHYVAKLKADRDRLREEVEAWRRGCALAGSLCKHDGLALGRPECRSPSGSKLDVQTSEDDHREALSDE